MSVSQSVTAAVGIGSNVGDRARNIDEAVRRLRATSGVNAVTLGPVIETAAVAWPGDEAGGAYLNSAAVVETTLPAIELLRTLHEIERSLGRDRAKETRRWGPRTIDLDLLLYGDQVIDEPGLKVPHPRMHERRFVLEPLCGLAPGLMVPTLGATVASLMGRLIEGEHTKH